MWCCEDCGWAWPLAGRPPGHAECDNCGGELAMEGSLGRDEIWASGDMLGGVGIVATQVSIEG